MSRELDAQVAEKVMGWHKKYLHPDGGEFWHSKEGRPEHRVTDENFRGGEKGFSPSTRIEDAWKVVERMLDRTPVTIKVGMSRTQVETYIRDRKPLLTGADTAPEAICLAALKAVAR